MFSFKLQYNTYFAACNGEDRDAYSRWNENTIHVLYIYARTSKK